MQSNVLLIGPTVIEGSSGCGRGGEWSHLPELSYELRFGCGGADVVAGGEHIDRDADRDADRGVEQLVIGF